jgi:alanine dehydrogenase
MIVGVPKELKNGENRVGLDPKHVRLLCAEPGVTVVVESGAGDGAGFPDRDYVDAGALVLDGHSAIYDFSHLIVKVKEVLREEYSLVKDGQAIAGYFHLPANPDLQRLIAAKQLKTLVYEDIVDERGTRPVLLPMSIIAGEAAANKSLDYLTERRGSVDPLEVKALVVGRGTVGLAAARMLVSRGLLSKNIVILESDPTRVNPNSEYTEGVCDPETAARAVANSDIIIGAAASRKKEAPKVVTRAMLGTMPAGGVLADVAVDEGGISETTRATSHSDPTYIKEGVLHYCVPNIPGAYPKRATQDLSAAAYPYILKFIRSNSW